MRYFLCLGCVVLIFSCCLSKTQAQVTPTTTLNSTLTVPTTPLLIQKIKAAKEQLSTLQLEVTTVAQYKNVNKGTKKKPKIKRVLSGYTADSKQIALAILDPATQQIGIVLGNQTDTSMTFNQAGFDVKLVRFNGVNSRFQVSQPAGGIVLAISYLITPIESGSKEAITTASYEGVYTPYSTALQTTEVATYGADYVNNLIKQVATELTHVPSVSKQGSTIIQAIDPNLVKSLIYAEHTDTTEFLSNPDTQSVIDKLNTLFACNEGSTYKYSVSSAGARGIAQFIPSTYSVLVQRHPDANLNPDFASGMSDHVNAVKSMYLLLDDYIQAVEIRAGDSFIPAHAFDYGAAAYNGGVTRVAKAAIQFGATWFEGQGDDVISAQNSLSTAQWEVAGLKAALKKAKKADKSKINKQLANATVVLNTAQANLQAITNAHLRTETILYIQKMHRLIQVFNS